MENQDGASLIHEAQAVNNQSNTTDEFELKMFWRIRWYLIYLYTTVLFVSLTIAVIFAIMTRNFIPSIIPASWHFAMRPIILWAFPNKLQIGRAHL